MRHEAAHVRELAKTLATAHRAHDEFISEIRLYPNEQEIRLVEVSSSVGNSGEVLPVRFNPSADISLPLVLILLSEEEKQQLDQGELELPSGWAASPFETL